MVLIQSVSEQLTLLDCQHWNAHLRGLSHQKPQFLARLMDCPEDSVDFKCSFATRTQGMQHVNLKKMLSS